MTSQESHDVIIVGGGLSGLSAAHSLKKVDATLSAVVLEANVRVGGRTVGKKLKCVNGHETFDLGGQWVGSCQEHIMELLKELNISIFDQFISGTKVMQLGGDHVSTYTSDIPSLPFYSLIELHFLLQKIERLRKQIPMDDPSLCAHAAEWDSMTMEQALRQWCWFQATRDAIESACRCMFGVELVDMSLFYFLMYVQAAGGMDPLISAKPNMGQEFRVSGGAYHICEVLADTIGRDRIHLNQVVVQITQDDTGVIVKTLSGKTYSSKRVVLALPPNQAIKIHYAPTLPARKLHVLQRMPVGYLTKVVVTFKRAFWREGGYSGEAVSNGGASVVSSCSTGPLNIVYDATSERGSPALVSFIGGKQQLEYAALELSDRRRAVIHGLARLFGNEALDFIDYAEVNWNEQPFNGGCPVCVGTPGVITHIAPGLRQPFGRLHFAGTESATVWCGFLNGAVQSGRRAAFEVLYNLRPGLIDAKNLQGTCYDSAVTKPASRSSQNSTSSFASDSHKMALLSRRTVLLLPLPLMLYALWRVVKSAEPCDRVHWYDFSLTSSK